ncbi:helix-turn-helix transcriptional regulator [Halalkalicoccus jeotgali]|uniref:HTH cro/C1-type domain-containing protein n=1 Tax=Halalkalicoccus jeotgali (strain DSM 18796 / CECT 7217 / JCM 14584 / KCTC 4019 / B3) TaxID=795797 RepID=D8J8M0_HALJB|nr:helix-turn-helix transcriptional regulator [Halalkalicoccus jeotgali]ADJ14205.1 hypothetical protein HacjB3_04070 [Halalkalicoccus jeotgali B3]ELY34613.1 hypothetical protein C497_15223 [Halalkalicoccus jeotgali B3]
MKNDLKVRRARHELTQSDLAEAVDVSRQTISAIEAGRYNPSLELAFHLAEYFDCSIEDIFEPPLTKEESQS